MTENYSHIPVMLDEVIDVLSPENGKIYVDCTFGTGGYSQAILQKADCILHAIDRDDNAFSYAQELKERFPTSFIFHHDKFSNLAQLGVKEADGIIFDIGVSSPQLDNPERGFSFAKEGKLDMGMGLNDLSAKDIVNGFSESDLADLIYEYGEEPFSRKIAKAIVNVRFDSNAFHFYEPCGTANGSQGKDGGNVGVFFAEHAADVLVVSCVAQIDNQLCSVLHRHICFCE